MTKPNQTKPSQAAIDKYIARQLQATIDGDNGRPGTLKRTKRLVLAALRVWELKQGRPT